MGYIVAQTRIQKIMTKFFFPHIPRSSRTFFEDVTIEMTPAPPLSMDDFIQKASDLFTYVMDCTHQDMYDQKLQGVVAPMPQTKFIDALYMIYSSLHMMDAIDHPAVQGNKELKEAIESLRKARGTTC